MEEKKYLKRKEKASSDGNRELLAVACSHLGDFYNQQGRFHNAVKEYQEAAIIYTKMGKKLETAKAHRMVGEMFMLLGEFDNAKEHINDYLKLSKKMLSKVEEQRAYATLGRSYLLHGQALAEISALDAMAQLKQAEKSFLKSLLLTKDLSGQISKLEQLDMQARCYLNIGVVKEHMEDFEEAINYMERAIKISKTHDIFELTHMCYISMSLMYHSKRNDATLALRYCNLALDVAKRFSQKVKKICETLIIKSEILIKTGDFSSAKQILTKAYKKNSPDENDRNTIEKSLRIVVKICAILDELITTSSVDYAKQKSLYEKLGDGCCHLGNYDKAIEYYLKMLDCADLNNERGKSLIPIYVSLYQTYKDNKQYDQALKYLWKEYELNKDEPKEAFSTLCSIAEICELQMQSFWTIQDIYQKAKHLAAKAGDARLKLEKIVYARLRKLHIKHDMNVLAEELVQEAISKGIDAKSLNDDSDTESDGTQLNENNTPEIGADVCLDNLTDTDTSDLDETEKPRPHRATRGTRTLAIKRNNKGETQLHQACISGNIELVRRLIDQGHIVNVRDHAGWLPLHEACNHGFYDIVRVLLDRGASVAINDKGGTSCDGITPLYDACSNGYFDVIELLLERGADATVKTDFGDTCLNGLDKWRKSVTLTEGDQVQYEQIRSRLIHTLSKIGISASQRTKAVTNLDVEFGQEKQKHFKKNRIVSGKERVEIDGDESDVVMPSTSRFAEKTREHLSNAGMEYKNAIEQLKHRKPIIESDDESYSICNSGKNKRSGYLNAEEIDEESWLIDDLGPEKKKRRYQTTPTNKIQSTSSNSKQYYTSPSNGHHISNQRSSENSSHSSWLRLSLTPENDSDTTSQHRQQKVKKISLSRSSSISSNAGIGTTSQRQKPKHQSSLLESGFCRFRSESSQGTSEDSNDEFSSVNVRASEPDSTTTSIQLLISPAKSSPIKVQTTPITLSTTVPFKVKVEDELLLVPIERKKLADINIRWLAEEASRRYYNLVGLKPVLRLKTADGFAYEENDTVNVAVEQNMIIGTVLEWQISPLGQRYQEMCLQMHKAINNEVQDVLQRAQISNSIYLSDFWLTPSQTEPIFKAILHQGNLRVLDLSNNFIQNEGCRQLAKSLSTLSQLKSLNLKGNFITTDGLESLLCGMDIEKASGIEDLILSQNPLGNSSLRALDSFCKGQAGRSLQKLHLSQCNLTQVFNNDLAFFQLTDFDISFNKLSDDSIHKLLLNLNSSRLQNLNLSYIKMEKNDTIVNYLAEKLTEFFESGTCEKFKKIELIGCHLNDVNIYKIVQSLSRSKDLELLNISNNVQLSNSSLYFIFDKLPQLRKLVAINCIHLIDAGKIESFTQLKHIPNLISITFENCNIVDNVSDSLCQLWRSHWGDKGKIKRYDNNLVLFTNDNDLSIS